jgi:hypothetical protein
MLRNMFWVNSLRTSLPGNIHLASTDTEYFINNIQVLREKENYYNIERTSSQYYHPFSFTRKVRIHLLSFK